VRSGRPGSARKALHLKRIWNELAAIRAVCVVCCGEWEGMKGSRMPFGDPDELKREKALVFRTLTPVSAED
jgi:hypothetical protein